MLLTAALAVGPAAAGTTGSSGIPPSAIAAARVPGVARGTPPPAPSITLYGTPLAEWTQQFWRWFFSIPLNAGPVGDATGVDCGVNQSGPVWFLAAVSANSTVTTCTMPAGKTILVPSFTYMNDYPCPAPPPYEPAPGQSLEQFLTEGAQALVDQAVVNVQLDGKSVKVHRVTAGLQTFTAAKDIVQIDGCITGSPQVGVSDGMFSVIGPLPPGRHTLRVTSSAPIPGDHTVNLIVVPDPK